MPPARAIGVASPLGPLTVRAEDGAITALDWRAGPAPDGDPLLTEAAAQLTAYFEGRLRAFTLPLAPRVTPFQKAFGDLLGQIPYGETRTYGEIARTLGVTAQAAGQACGANPIPILIPCHRVLGAVGLGGYSGKAGSRPRSRSCGWKGRPAC